MHKFTTTEAMGQNTVQFQQRQINLVAVNWFFLRTVYRTRRKRIFLDTPERPLRRQDDGSSHHAAGG